MSVDIIGYSERGMMNAISEDLAHSGNPDLVGDFLSQFWFQTEPTPDWKNIKQVKILVEQSFSDFGDADMLILIEHNNRSKKAIFVEAKVSNDTNSWETIEKRWNEFLYILDVGEGSTSNLLVQLYRKVRLVEKLRNEPDQFATDLLIPRGSLGSNQTVGKAAELVRKFVCEGDVYFVAILPDTTDALTQFFGEELSSASLGEKLPCWSVQNFGFLSWHKMAEALTKVQTQNRWPRTTATLEWNAGQIFRPENPTSLFQFGNVCLFENQRVYVVGAGGGKTCRVAPLDKMDDGFFWRTSIVDSSLLSVPEIPVPLGDVPRLPQTGGVYLWDSGQDSDRLPAESVGVQIQPNTQVTVIGRPSWCRTGVQFVGASANLQPFRVFTHHLKRQLSIVQK
jgi:hypothetical protein